MAAPGSAPAWRLSYGTACLRRRYGYRQKSELRVWDPADEEELTPSVIRHLAWDIRDGKADPKQARKLLLHFLDCAEGGRPLPGPLLEFLRDAFTEYLTDPRPGKLEKLLGLTRRGRGKPVDRKTARRHHRVAWEVLQRRLEGKSLFDAAFDVGIHENTVQDIWTEHKHLALDLEAASRARESPDKKERWTDEEKTRMKRMYGDYIFELNALSISRIRLIRLKGMYGNYIPTDALHARRREKRAEDPGAGRVESYPDLGLGVSASASCVPYPPVQDRPPALDRLPAAATPLNSAI